VWGGGCECENKLCVKFHERSTRVFQAHYHSVLVKRELTNRQWAVGRRTCRADKHLAKRRRDDGEAEERSTSLLFLRGVSDGASQGRSAFRPARRPSRHMCGNLRGRAEKIPGGTIVPITKTPDPPIIMMNLVLCKNWHNAVLLPE